MDKKNSDKVKNLIIILSFILIVIALLIAIIIFTYKMSNEPSDNTTEKNTTNSANENDINDTSNNTNTNSSGNTISGTEEPQIGKLNKTIEAEDYFWLEDKIEWFYSSEIKDDPTALIDKDVIAECKITADNYTEFNNLEGAIFRIDEIYYQELDENKIAYVVKHKIGKTKEDVQNAIVWIVRDKSKGVFSVYPYEYLKRKNYLSFKEGDTLPLNSSKQISENDYNKYDEDDLDVDAEACMKGLFERYKFDIMLDEEHLFNSLDDEYKKIKYSNIEELRNYINNNQTDFYLDSISTYKLINYGAYVEYRAICNSKRNIVFHAQNMMDYTMYLDNYHIVNFNTYDSFASSAQAEYCIDRTIEALNYQDYEFVYSKLNPVQKNNYYKDIDSFKAFLNKITFKENEYKLDDNYLIISDNVYQYEAKITDATGEDPSYANLVMTVTLKDNADFIISIKNKNE